MLSGVPAISDLGGPWWQAAKRVTAVARTAGSHKGFATHFSDAVDGAPGVILELPETGRGETGDFLELGGKMRHATVPHFI
jgi:hypothetical protein